VINKVLKELYYNLLAKYPNLTFTVNTIYLDTNIAIHHVKLAFKHCFPHTLINITSFNFENLYLNISVLKTISLILFLYKYLDINSLYEFKITITRSKNNSYNENLQKMQQTLPIVHPLKINKQTLHQLIQLVLIDNSYLICEWIPYKIFQ
jgi:hypothetical protein